MEEKEKKKYLKLNYVQHKHSLVAQWATMVYDIATKANTIYTADAIYVLINLNVSNTAVTGVWVINFNETVNSYVFVECSM